jgi:hypothetical protein
MLARSYMLHGCKSRFEQIRRKHDHPGLKLDHCHLGLRALLHSIVQSICNMDGFELWLGKGKVKRKQDISRNILGIY